MTDLLPPPAPMIVDMPKPKSRARKIFRVIGITLAVMFGISWVATLLTPDAKTSAPIVQTTPDTVVPAVQDDSSSSASSNIDDATATWALTAYPATQEIVSITEGITSDSDVSDILSACLKLGPAGHHLAAGAPASKAGDEAREVESAFVSASAACADGDIEGASNYMDTAVTHFSALNDELTRIAG